MFRRLNRTPWYVKTKRFFAERWTYQRPFRCAGRHPRFDTFVTLLILVSTAAMAAEHHGMDPEHASLLETANTLMTLAFALEMVLKLIGLGVVEVLLGSVQPIRRVHRRRGFGGARGRGRGHLRAPRAASFARAS